MPPFHDSLPLRDAPPKTSPTPSDQETQKFINACILFSAAIAALLGFMFALACSNSHKSKQIRHLRADLRRFQDEEDVAGQGGIVLRGYEARGLPALKAKLEATEKENAVLRERLRMTARHLHDARRGVVGSGLQVEADEEEEQLEAARVRSLASPSASNLPPAIAMARRNREKGKQKEVAPSPIRRKPVPGHVQNVPSSKLRLSQPDDQNGDIRRRPIHIHPQSIAQSEAGSIGMMEDSSGENNSPYSPNIPTPSVSRDQRDPLYFIDEVADMPVTSPRRRPTPFPTSPQDVPPGFSRDGFAHHRRSYADQLRRQTNTVASPGAKTLPAMSPKAEKFDEVSLDD